MTTVDLTSLQTLMSMIGRVYATSAHSESLQLTDSILSHSDTGDVLCLLLTAGPIIKLCAGGRGGQ
jgi:hypothetical protein